MVGAAVRPRWMRRGGSRSLTMLLHTWSVREVAPMVLAVVSIAGPPVDVSLIVGLRRRGVGPYEDMADLVDGFSQRRSRA